MLKRTKGDHTNTKIAKTLKFPFEKKNVELLFIYIHPFINLRNNLRNFLNNLHVFATPYIF